jgi:hypothetical protein
MKNLIGSKYRKKILLVLLCCLFLSSPIILALSHDFFDKVQDFNEQISDWYESERDNIIKNNSLDIVPAIKKDIRPEEEDYYPYSPILSTEDSSDQLFVNDHIRYEESDDLSLRFNRTGSVSADYIGDNYSIENLGYNDLYYETNITDITAIKDFYSYESYSGGLVGILRDTPGMQYLAQGFEVKWDQADFYRARLYIEGAGNTDEIRIHLVPSYIEGSRIKPDFGVKLSSTIWYNARVLPTPIRNGTTILELPTYDFSTIVTLKKGIYFLVVEFRDRDDKVVDLFLWYGNHYDENPIKSPLSYQSPSIGFNPKWLDINFNFTLEVELLPVDSLSQPLIITNPRDIDLKDNNILLNSTFSKIEGQFTGNHLFSSNTSVNISCIRFYMFEKDYITQSIYSISNSTFGENTCFWNITWASDQISTFYSIVSRNLTLNIPNDWSDSFIWYYNQSLSFPSEKSSEKYISYLNSNSSAGVWNIETLSPNHIFESSFSDGVIDTNRYFLGFWSTNGSHAFGHNGSEIYVSAKIGYNTTSFVNDTTGTLNFTLFDRNGNFLPIKSSLNESLSFIDVTSYSSFGIVNTTPGLFQTSLIFDPSINGSDLSGFWTVVVYWTNGTEVGFYSQKIVVQTRTIFEAIWEEIPESDMWTDNTQINRKADDMLKIRTFYYNISEPYFNVNGTDIINANIFVKPSWYSSNIKLNYSNQVYETAININSTVGNYSIDILATSPFLENHTISVSLTIFYTSIILPVDYVKYSTYYSYDAIYKFRFANISNTLNNSIDIQSLSVEVNDTILSSNQFSYQTVNEETTLILYCETIALLPGIYIIEIYAHHDDFRASYAEQDASFDFELEITKIHYNIDLEVVEDEIRQLEGFHFRVEIIVEILTSLNDIDLKIAPQPQGQINISYIFIFKNGSEIINQYILEIEEDHSEPYSFESEMILIPWQVTQLNYTAIFIPEDTLQSFIEISETDSSFDIDIERPRMSKLLRYLVLEYNYIILPLIFVLLATFTFLIVFLAYIRPRKKKKKEDKKKETYSRITKILSNVASIKKIIAVHQESSLPVFELDMESKIDVDSSLITGFFQAISSIGKEISKGEALGIRKFDYGEFSVSCATEDYFTVYLISSKSLIEELEEGLSQFTNWFNEVFRFIAISWTGSVDRFNEYRTQITDKIAEKLYVWTLYSFEVNPAKDEEIQKLSKLEKRIIEITRQTDDLTLSFLLDNLEEYSIEDKLISIFYLMENRFLLQKTFGAQFAQL